MSSEWREFILGDCVDLQRGNTYKSPLLGQPGPVLLGLASIARNGGFRSDNLKTYGGTSDPRMLLESGDIYVSLKDVTQSADLLGSVARVPEFISQGRLTQDTAKLIFKSYDIPKNYIYWLLRTPQSREHCRAHATGTTTLGLPREDFLSLPIPPLNETRISLLAILEALDDKIENNRRMNATLEAMAQALFKSWFVDFDPVRAKAEGREPEGMDAATAALFPDRLVDSELGEVPEGWEVRKLDSLCRVINGRAYKNTEFKVSGTPIVRIQNLSGGGKTVYSDLELHPDKYIDKEDFIYAWSATFGPYIWRGAKSIYHYHIWKVEVDDSIVSRYFMYLTMRLKTEAMKNTGTGSIFTHLTKQIMESQDVLIADSAVNQYAGQQFESIFLKITALEEQNRILGELRDTLLPKLISGELRVPEAEEMMEAVR